MECYGFSNFILEIECNQVVDERSAKNCSSSVLGLSFDKIWSLMEKLNVSIHYIK